VANGSGVTRFNSTVKEFWTTMRPSIGAISPIPGGCVAWQAGGGPCVSNSMSSTTRLLLKIVAGEASAPRKPTVARTIRGKTGTDTWSEVATGMTPVLGPRIWVAEPTWLPKMS
jgi:hypothetical protein